VKGSASFLKKRSKKLLLTGAGVVVSQRPMSRVEKVFAPLFSKSGLFSVGF
jgi:hypothetical protein